MSDERLGLHQDGLAYTVKTLLGPALTAIGLLTLQDWAVVAGLLCSVVITIQTLLNIYFKLKDRRARRGPGRNPQDE